MKIKTITKNDTNLGGSLDGFSKVFFYAPSVYSIGVEELILVVGIVINALIALFIFYQVRIIRRTNQQNVMPILGITVRGRPEGEIMASELVIYVRHGIALDIECEVLKNGKPFLKEKWDSAVPSLRGDECLPIHTENIFKDLPNLVEGGIEYVLQAGRKVSEKKENMKLLITPWSK